jgi:hypothetical protein
LICWMVLLTLYFFMNRHSCWTLIETAFDLLDF